MREITYHKMDTEKDMFYTFYMIWCDNVKNLITNHDSAKTSFERIDIAFEPRTCQA